MLTTVFFDLDGTLTDSAEGIINSVLYALNKMNIRESDTDKLRCFVGPPLRESFSRFYGLSAAESEQAIRYYREHFVPRGMLENTVYPGVEQLLADLKKMGLKIVLTTAKPEPFAGRILDHFHLSSYFDAIYGASLDDRMDKKEDVIAYAMAQCHLTDPTEIVMVGDRENDVTGAALNQIKTIGVLYGYGSKKELQDAGAAWIAESVQDIGKIIRQLIHSPSWPAAEKKQALKPGTLLNPVPAVMVSCGSQHPNIITVAWTGIINSDPPLTYISVRPSRFSHDIIEQEGEFVINLTTKTLAFATDFCGVRSGRDIDKFKAQNLTPAACEYVKCPMIAESPVNLECIVKEKHEYGSHDMYVAEIVNVHVDEDLIDEKGRIALEKAGLIGYVHGEYYEMTDKPLGRFGYSVMKLKTKKRLMQQKKKTHQGKSHEKNK